MTPRRPRQRRREPTIALINVVFLMLVFFLVAGSVAPPLDSGLRLVRTDALGPAAPPDALVIHADGRLVWRGAPVTDAEAWWRAQDEAETVARIVPDRDLPAAELLRVGAALHAAGAARVVIVTERGLR